MISESDIVIYDDLLSPEDFYELRQKVIESKDWAYANTTTGACARGCPDHLGNYQVTNVCYDKGYKQNDLFYACAKFLDAIDACMFTRIKFNLNMAYKENVPQGWHADLVEAVPCVRTGIFYLHNTDGYTMVETDDGIVEVECRENRFVSFPSTTMHSGVTHTNRKERIVLNINYVPWHTY